MMPKLTDLQTRQVNPWGALHDQMVDTVTATIPAGVFTPNYLYTLTDTGTNAMTGITVPYPTFCGPIAIIPGGAFTWTTATNIAISGTAVTGKLLFFLYNPTTAKWYPSYTS